MSPTELLTLIVGVSFLVVLISAIGFVVFGKFLNKERVRGEMFRSVHRDESQPRS